MEIDIVIIGGGQAGVPLARGLAKAGRQVALVERVHLGGSCVNFGCTPSKAMIASAGIAHYARQAAQWGVHVPAVAVDFAAVMDRARRIVAESKTSLDDSVHDSPNPRLIDGHGRLAGRVDGRLCVEVGAERLLASHVVLDTGTRSRMPDIPGLDSIPLLTAENWIDMTMLPERLVIIGGSTLALEFAQAFGRLGAKIVILQSGRALAEREDPDISDAIAGFLRAEGIETHLGVDITRIERTGDGVRVHGDGLIVQGTHLLVATGRLPNTDDLGLDTIGIPTTKQGMIAVDHRLATNIEGVWAAGDIRGGPAFTHTAYADHQLLLDQIAGDGRRTTQGRIVPYAMFLDPELGRVGMTETEARAAGHRVRVGIKPMTTSGKARETGRTAGFIKLVIDADSDRFLGAACLCESGAEVVQIFTALMHAGVTASDSLGAIAIHPTIGEAAKNAVVDAR